MKAVRMKLAEVAVKEVRKELNMETIKVFFHQDRHTREAFLEMPDRFFKLFL